MVFTDALKSIPSNDLTVIIHKTACGGFCSALGIARDFQNSPQHKSAHFIVGRDGSIVQVVLLKDGAGANCCLETGHDTYWDGLYSTYGNLNRCTVSIEHEDWTSDNSQPMTQEQIQASLNLCSWLAHKYHIPYSQFKGHNTLDPLSRARCPGPTFPWNSLQQALSGSPTQLVWFQYPIGVPFGNPNYDPGLGGSHDLTILAPPNAPVTSIVSGTVSDISAPAWGKQVGIKLDSPVNGVPYFHYLHLSAVNPNLQLGQRVNIGDLVGWVGGGTTQAMYQGTVNPTGQNFLNDTFSSSQIQVGIALMRGPAYGGPGWQNFPPIDMTLDPTPILNAARNVVQKGSYMEQQFDAVWLSGAGTHADGTPWVARKSGIYEGTKAAFLAGKVAACCPTRDEIRTVDWSGGAGIYQPLSTGDYAFYQNGHCRIYDNRNHVIWG